MKLHLLSNLFLLFFIPLSSMARQAIIKGRITDAVNKEVLTGATISVKDSRNSTITDLNGEFFLYVTPGSVQLTISYLGYKDSTLQVTVNDAATKVVQIGLNSTYRQLSNIIVTGLLQGQAKALNQQKNADNIKNVIAADQIGRFPDPNAAEALQRVPGVNIERDQGEGRYVFVRGLAPQFTNVNINGEQIPSPEADVRYVALDAIPSDQLASIEVSKSLTPDMDGDAVGGSVNLVTRTAQSKTARINSSLTGGYNQLMNRANIQGQLHYSQRLGKQEKLGMMFNSSYYHNDLGSDNIERAPEDNEVELRDYELTRTRLGLSSTIDYKFNANHEVYFRGLYSRFTDREWRRRYTFKPEDEEVEKDTKDRFESQSVTSLNLGAKHKFKRFFLDYEGQYSLGEQKTPYDNAVTFVAAIPTELNYDNPKFPGISGPVFSDNSLYEFDEAEFGHTLAKDKNITAKFNIGIPYSIRQNSGLLKFGAKMRRKEKNYSIYVDYYSAYDDIPTLDAFDEDPVKSSFLDGRYNLGRPLSVTKFIGYFNTHPSEFEAELEDKSIDEALEAYTAEENVYAAYIMARQQFRKLMLLAGVRYEKTKVTYNSSDVIIDGAGDLEDIIPVTGSSEYDFFLPQASIRYQFSKFTNLRAAATFSYARPNFSEIIPAQEINQEDEEATAGNSNLKPVSAFNFDLLGEHYFGNVGLVSGGFFYKRLRDFIYRRVIFNSPYPLTGPALINDIDVIQARNGNDADITGFEIAFQNNLAFLTAALKNFSLYCNYTYTHSSARLQSRDADESDPGKTETIRLPGQATHVGNLSLAFENKKFNLRTSLNFNGEYLSEAGSSKEEDLFVKNRLQMDISSSYAFNKHWRLFAEVLNITNQPFEVYMGNKNQLIQREFYSWWSRLGIKFDL